MVFAGVPFRYFNLLDTPHPWLAKLREFIKQCWSGNGDEAWISRGRISRDAMNIASRSASLACTVVAGAGPGFTDQQRGTTADAAVQHGRRPAELKAWRNTG